MSQYRHFGIILACILVLVRTSYAEESPFDVLNDNNRYKSESAEEFDVNEGAEEESSESVSTTSHNVFDLMPKLEQTGSFYNTAKIIALNKITARSKELEIKVGDTAYFGNIAITLKQCWNNDDSYLPENKILLHVVENKIDEDPQNIFLGWLISGNMSVSALEHPSYELIAIGCFNGKK